MSEDEKYISYALSLACKGGVNVIANPLVGAVIVCDNRIIGEGYHKVYGKAHAEVNAVNSVKSEDEHLLPMSTMYVNLEPCCHTGKTPPCTELIIAKKIKRVVIGMQDPFPKVDGEGIRIMRNAGIDVTVGILEEKCRKLNREFIVFHKKKRPYVIFKWAQTIDGYIDSDRDAETPPEWLTGAHCKRIVHKWRSETAGIMVGSSTVIRDNPELTVRAWSGKNPHRFVIDRKGVLTEESEIFSKAAATTVFCSSDKKTDKEWVEYYKIDFEKRDWFENMMSYMYRHKIKTLLLEGGYRLFNIFMEHGALDEARIFISPKMLSELRGGETLKGIKAPLLPKCDIHKSEIIDGILLKSCYYI